MNICLKLILIGEFGMSFWVLRSYRKEQEVHEVWLVYGCFFKRKEEKAMLLKTKHSLKDVMQGTKSAKSRIYSKQKKCETPCCDWANRHMSIRIFIHKAG